MKKSITTLTTSEIKRVSGMAHYSFIHKEDTSGWLRISVSSFSISIPRLTHNLIYHSEKK